MARPSPVAFHDARLTVPDPGEGAIERERVTDRLERAIQRHHVTLITGSGGSGKTYAVAMWSASTAPERDPWRVAWASLDRADVDPHRFWLTVVGALQRVLVDEVVAGLAVPSRPNQHFVDMLCAALAGAGDGLVLILDDVHELAGSASMESLEQLRHGLPRQHRLVLVSRHDPPLHLHRLRLAGQLGELRSADLAFSTAEATQMLRASGLDLADPEMDHLMATTEGWAAGLRLATVAIESSHDPSGVVRQFSGRHSLVTAYLSEEVVSGLGPERTDFLLRTCVVDRICAPLARTLSGLEASGAMLESLVEDNIFISALEDSGWYRYHPMLQEMLRARLAAAAPDLAGDLHRRAQSWFEGSGEWLEALRHARLSGDESLAAQVALRCAAILAFSPQRVRLAHELAPLRTGFVRGQDPERLLCLGLAAYCVDDDEASLSWIEQAEPALGSLPEPRRQVATLVHRLLRTAKARRAGDLPSMSAAAADALRIAAALTPEVAPACHEFRAAAVSMAGVSELWSGRPGESESLLRSAVRGGEAGFFGVYGQVYHGGLLALSEAARGSVRAGRARAEAVLESARSSGWSPSHESGPAWLALAIVNLYAADLLATDRCLTSAQQTHISTRDPFIGAAMSLVAARSAVSAGDLVRARRSLAGVDRWVAARPGPSVIWVLLIALRAEMHLVAGAPSHAALTLAEIDGHLESGGGDGPVLGSPTDLVALTRAHTLLASGRPEEALRAVRGLLTTEGALGSEAWLVTALAQDRLRQDASATEALDRALAYGEREGAVHGFLRPSDRLRPLLRRHLDVVGSHVEFTLQVLDRLGGVRADAAVAATGPVTLTDRELSVLAYLPTLSTNPEIAAQLNISVNTVKQHLKTINRKLGVGSRREAVRVARRLGLIPDHS